MAADTAGNTPRGGALGRLWRRAVGWPGRVQAWWSDLSPDGRDGVWRRIRLGLAVVVAPVVGGVLVGFGYLAGELIDAYSAVRDLDYGALDPDELVAIFRNLLWGASAFAGALVAVIGLGLAAWRSITFHRQSLIEQRRVETETFSKAMELLGNEEFAIRLGGILQLETLAQQSPRLHWPIMEAFCAYLREPGERTRKEQAQTAEQAGGFNRQLPFVTGSESHPTVETTLDEGCPQDVQAIITAIVRRDTANDPKKAKINLTGAHLPGVDLSWASLDGYIFRRANLTNANFMGASLKNTSFMEADLRKSYLRYANLSGAFLLSANFENAFLRDCDLSSTHCDLANFRNADFKRARIHAAKLGASFVHQDQISMSIGDVYTELREDLFKPRHWAR